MLYMLLIYGRNEESTALTHMVREFIVAASIYAANYSESISRCYPYP